MRFPRGLFVLPTRERAARIPLVGVMPMNSFCLSSIAQRPVESLSSGRWPSRSSWAARLNTRVWSAALVLVLLLPGALRGYTPESPEVTQMLDKATAFLEQPREITQGVGADCLVAMALLKSGKEQGHPRVQSAIAKSQKLAESVAREGIGNYCYNAAITAVFLCELDPKRFQSEINIIVQAMTKRQLPNGPWGYWPHTYDDTSQTQYGVLCYWAAHHAGWQVPARGVEAALQWLIRTQNHDGGWVYSPRDPQNYERINQGVGTHSMAAAGLSSVYICAHLLGLGADARRSGQREEKSDLPPALQKVETEETKKKKLVYLQPSNTNVQQLAQTMAAGNAWFDKNMTYEIKKWTHYYMYAVERHRSFQELFEGKVESEPQWYNDGVEYLQKTQLEDGSWKTEETHGSGPLVDTSFAMLFLTRSSQKSIRKATLDEGILVGGMGLPRDLTNARMQDGKVVTPQMVRDVDDLLELLSSTEDKGFDPTALPGGLSLDADLTKRTSQLERLRELVTNENYEARLAAVKTLAQARDLDNVPALIYALSDPDWRIVEAARDGLCLISRKMQGYGPPPQATEQQIQAARAKWKAWYLAIRPDGQLMD
jgi:hypothetical protein